MFPGRLETHPATYEIKNTCCFVVKKLVSVTASHTSRSREKKPNWNYYSLSTFRIADCSKTETVFRNLLYPRRHKINYLDNSSQKSSKTEKLIKLNTTNSSGYWVAPSSPRLAMVNTPHACRPPPCLPRSLRQHVSIPAVHGCCIHVALFN